MTNPNGRFGIHGGQYIPETLMNAVIELEQAYDRYKDDPGFNLELSELLNEYAGRPSRLYYARRMTEDLGGAKVYLKREDLNHTGAHKINNVLGQVLLARRMGKTRVIAETGAGQHGVATATAAALMGMECVVYMGREDTIRQALNVYRMRLLGAEVRPVDNGTGTLTLSGAGSGPVDIYAGTILSTNASAPITTGTITVRKGGTLSGTGQVSAVSVQADGILAAGKSATAVGTLTLTSTLNVAKNGVLSIRFRKGATGTVTSDHWKQAGRVTLNNPVIRVTQLGDNALAVGDELQLFSGTGSIVLTGTPTIEMADGEGWTWDTSRLATEGIIVVAGMPTGIGEMDDGRWTMDDASIYDLSGRAQSASFFNRQSRKAIYIVNGQKRVRK